MNRRLGRNRNTQKNEEKPRRKLELTELLVMTERSHRTDGRQCQLLQYTLDGKYLIVLYSRPGWHNTHYTVQLLEEQ